MFNYKPFDGTEDDVLWDTESNGSNGTTHSSGSEGDIVSVRRKQWIHCLQIFLFNVCQMKHYSLNIIPCAHLVEILPQKSVWGKEGGVINVFRI